MKHFYLLLALFIIYSCSLEDAEKQLKDLIGSGDDKSDTELITVLETDNPDNVEVIDDNGNLSSDFVIDEDLDNFSINRKNQFEGPLSLSEIIALRKRGEHLAIGPIPRITETKRKILSSLKLLYRCQIR